DLLRLGLRADDAAIFLAAAQALAATATKDALIDLEDALARADDIRAARAVDAALGRLAADDAGSKQFVAHLRAVREATARATNEPFFATMLPGRAAAAPPEREAVEHQLDLAEAAVKAAPKDPQALQALALANVEL